MKGLSFAGKRVLVRVDFNVPLSTTNEITDDNRIKASLPTLRHILAEGGSLILCSHLGRPQQEKTPQGELDIARFTLRHIQGYLENALGRKVRFVNDCIGKEAQSCCRNLAPGDVILLENTRFHKGEEKGDDSMARELASLADIYINDAFGSAHRAHVSTTGVAHYFSPESRGFGFLMDAEVANANRLLSNTEKPFAAIIGGAKVSDKLLLLDRMLELVDMLLIGGGMAFTFIRARGGHIGGSLVEPERLELAAALLDRAARKGVMVLLPVDVLAADRFANDAITRTVPAHEIPDSWLGLDIGPQSAKLFREALGSVRTILWNGPMGVFEMPAFATGTLAVAQAVADATRKGAFSLVGGGDSVAAVTQAGLVDAVSYVSTGGGALLEMLEGKVLPGVKAILD